jgi:hypothetical protein
MSVETLHPSYINHSKNWKFMRDCVEGDDSIKAGKETYIPRLSGQEEDEYKAYLNRAIFEGYTFRVLNGLTGLMFAKPPVVEVPKQLEDLFDNFNLKGSTLTDYVQELASEVESVNRVGALVDNSADSTNNRPYATIYPTETILNWKHENINDNQVLTMVVLKETEDSWADMFTNDVTTIYRVLLLATSETNKTRHYQQWVYKPNEKKEYSSEPTEIITPLMNGKPLSYIPFVSITDEKLTIEPEKSPLLDLARVNLAHFKLNVDYYHGMHFTALPTPYGSGINHDPKKDPAFKIGSTSFNFYRDPHAKLSYLEFEGKGLETLENEKTKLIESMVVLGSNMLQGDKKTAEAENTVAMRSAGQNATLISTADTISRGVTRILEIMAEWMGLPTDGISYKLNTDFNLTQTSPQMIKEMIVGRTLGEIPREVLFDTLKQGEMLKDDMSFEDFETKLSEESPIVAPSALPPKANNNELDIDSIAKKIGAK